MRGRVSVLGVAEVLAEAAGGDAASKSIRTGLLVGVKGEYDGSRRALGSEVEEEGRGRRERMVGV